MTRTLNASNDLEKIFDSLNNREREIATMKTELTKREKDIVAMKKDLIQYLMIFSTFITFTISQLSILPKLDSFSTMAGFLLMLTGAILGILFVMLWFISNNNKITVKVVAILFVIMSLVMGGYVIGVSENKEINKKQIIQEGTPVPLNPDEIVHTNIKLKS